MPRATRRGMPGHPARFPLKLPAFFIELTTDPGDLVVDFFSGSNSSGRAAEDLGRRWLSFELDREYAAISAVRFMKVQEADVVTRAVKQITEGSALAL